MIIRSLQTTVRSVFLFNNQPCQVWVIFKKINAFISNIAISQQKSSNDDKANHMVRETSVFVCFDPLWLILHLTCGKCSAWLEGTLIVLSIRIGGRCASCSFTMWRTTRRSKARASWWIDLTNKSVSLHAIVVLLLLLLFGTRKCYLDLSFVCLSRRSSNVQ